MTTPRALTDAVEAGRGLIDVAVLRDAIAIWDSRWAVAVVGRVSTGKSTLVNLLAGEKRSRVGLGGVTKSVTEFRIGEVAVFDTPGIDDEAGALATLQPLLEAVDVVVWVVDGLQPLAPTG